MVAKLYYCKECKCEHESPEVNQVMAELEAVMDKHEAALSHEDGHGSFILDIGEHSYYVNF